MNGPDDLPDAQRPLWVPLAHVARPIGLTPDMMLASIEAGQLPIRVQRFGLRGQMYAHRADTLRYFRSVLHPAEGTV